MNIEIDHKMVKRKYRISEKLVLTLDSLNKIYKEHKIPTKIVAIYWVDHSKARSMLNTL